MENPSCRKFESFDDFLDGFAYIDADLATYALYTGSSPETDNINLTCGDPECKKSFRVHFKPRSLLQMDQCSTAFLKAMKSVVDASGDDARELYEGVPHKVHKAYKMPNSGRIVHFRFATAREYLELVMKNNDIEDFHQNHPDDINCVKQLNRFSSRFYVVLMKKMAIFTLVKHRIF